MVELYGRTMKPLLFFASYIAMAFLTWGYLVQRPERLLWANDDWSDSMNPATPALLGIFWPIYWATEAAKGITKPR